jgi:hypothetical protein
MMGLKTLLFVLLLTSFSIIPFGTAELEVQTEWSVTLSEFKDNYLRDIQQTPDGGYILVGRQVIFGDNFDILVIKVNPTGDIDWSTTLDYVETETALSIRPTSDEGYIIAGEAYSERSGDRRSCVWKIDSNGDLLWRKIITDSYLDRAHYAVQTSDDNYVVLVLYDGDLYLVKLDQHGAVIGSEPIPIMNEYSDHFLESKDGTYILAGETSFSYSGRNADLVILQYDSKGNAEGGKILETPNLDEILMSFIQTPDGGFVLSGYTYDRDKSDSFILKTDAQGEILWNNTNPTSINVNRVFSSKYIPGEGYYFIVREFLEETGSKMHLLSISLDGAISQIYPLDMDVSESISSVQPTDDGGFIILGLSEPRNDNYGDSSWSESYDNIHLTKISIGKSGTLNINIVDENESILSDVTIVSITTPVGQSSFESKSDLNGFVTFPSLLTGEYEIQVSKSGYQTTNIKIIVTEDDLGIQNITLSEQLYSIEFTISDSITQTSLSGATIASIIEPNEQVKLESTTQSNGKTSFSNLLNGEYVFNISKNGYESKSISISTDASTIRKNILLDPIASENVVVDEPDEPDTNTNSPQEGSIPGYSVVSLIIGISFINIKNRICTLPRARAKEK